MSANEDRIVMAGRVCVPVWYNLARIPAYIFSKASSPRVPLHHMIWVLIPLAAILVGAFSEWLKFKEKQLQLGDSTSSLEHEFKSISAENERLVERIRNLEAIVTSQSWDALPKIDPQVALEDPEVYEPESDEERARKLASRVRT